MGWVTDRAKERIAKQTQQMETIKGLYKRIDEYQKSGEADYECMYLARTDLTIIQEALKAQWVAAGADIERQESSIRNGSEDGDLRSHSEKDILNMCVALMKELTEDFAEYLDFIGVETEPEERYSKRMYYCEIVEKLFLWGTLHSGGTSTAAKCRELGVEPDDAVEFTINQEAEEDE